MGIDYERRTVERYHEHYKEFYALSYAEALVGQTTRAQADMEAEAAAHYMTQRVMCQTDLYYLATEVFGMGTARYQGRKIWYPDFHGPLCDELQEPHDSMIQYSRFMLKSTVLKILVVQQIIADPVNVAIGLWSRSSSRVRIASKSIAGMLQNPVLLELFADRLIADGRKWEKRNFGQEPGLTVTRKVPDEEGNVRAIPMDEAQLEVAGLDSIRVGRHYTLHLYDDIIDNDNASTANMMEKAQEDWREIEAMRSPNTISKMVGTPWHQYDLYSTAIEEGHFDGILLRPGVDAEDRILYPFYTRDFLNKQRRKLGEYLYGCQYRLDTRPRSHVIFMLPVPFWKPEEFPDDPRRFIAVDPSTGKSTDKTGFAVGSVDRKNPTAVFYEEAYSELLRPEAIAKRLVDLIEKYNPEAVGIEFGLQVALEPLITGELSARKQTNGYFRTPKFIDIKTGGGRKALDKGTKIDRMLGAMTRERRAFFLPSMRKLFIQMQAFNPNAQKNDDDILDACTMLLQIIPSFAAAHWPGLTVETPVGGFSIDFFKKGRKRGHRIFAA